jgi:geranylgeranyl diphosphate synthase type II
MATVHEKYGQNTAILSGDVMLVFAYHYISQVDKQLLPLVLSIFNRVSIGVCEGQQMDMLFESESNVHLSEYIKMIELKTAVLLAGSLEIGALIGGAKEQDAGHLYYFGRDIGIAFQIMDDYLDTFGDPEKFGKKTGGDIVQNKKTYLLIKSLETEDHDLRKELLHWINSDSKDEQAKIEAVKALYVRAGADIAAKEAMQHYYDLATGHLKAVKAPHERKLPLMSLTESLFMRES